MRASMWADFHMSHIKQANTFQQHAESDPDQLRFGQMASLTEEQESPRKSMNYIHVSKKFRLLMNSAKCVLI